MGHGRHGGELLEIISGDCCNWGLWLNLISRYKILKSGKLWISGVLG